MAVSCLLVSCERGNQHSSNELKFDLQQLDGIWLSDGKERQEAQNSAASVEIWRMQGEGQIEGSDLVIFGETDTVLIANLKILKKDSVWMNEVAVNPKTNPVPVPFKLHSSSENEMKFRNTVAGSPEMICYQLKENNKLLVYLESNSKSGNNRTEFHYSRTGK
jgi:hypothetical protein